MTAEDNVAFFDITPEILVEICKGLTEGIIPKRFRVVKNGLPKDASFVSAETIGEPLNSRIRISVRSSKFTGGEILPSTYLECIADNAE